MKTLVEIKEFNKNTTVTTVYVEGMDYPYFFINGESLGWGEYIDFSNFNPFKALGFTEVTLTLTPSTDAYDYDIQDYLNEGLNLSVFLERIEVIKSNMEIKITISRYN